MSELGESLILVGRVKGGTQWQLFLHRRARPSQDLLACYEGGHSLKPCVWSVIDLVWLGLFWDVAGAACLAHLIIRVQSSLLFITASSRPGSILCLRSSGIWDDYSGRILAWQVQLQQVHIRTEKEGNLPNLTICNLPGPFPFFSFICSSQTKLKMTPTLLRVSLQYARASWLFKKNHSGLF